MNGPLVSVIIPVYNVKEYLDYCIKSILCQSYTNLEVLLIDDGSTDGSGDICDSYAAIDNRIKVFHGLNRGLSAARNIGLQKSNGQWVTFVDSDDLVQTKMIESLLSSATKHKANVAIGDTIIIDKSTAEFGDKGKSDEGYKSTVLDSVSVLENLLNGKMRMSVWGMLFDINLVRTALFSEGRIYEDIPYLPLALKTRPKVVLVDKIVYGYRRNPDSITHQRLDIRFSDRVIMKELQVKRIQQYFPELNALAIGSLYSDYMLLWVGTEKIEDEKVARHIRQLIKKCISRNPLSWSTVLNRKITIRRRASLIASKISFTAACELKRYIVRSINSK